MVSGLITAATFLSPSAGPVRWGVWLAAGLALPSYWTLSLALRGSNGFFFGVFLGGILGRLAGVAAGIVAAWRFDPSTVALFALSAAGALAGLSIIEVYFIGRQNRLPQ
ncbi:MAG: hypothetical protein KBG07_06155 [Elusimicrobia bacterium]|nr:hypothetical protein [Elusimicrobiota bacterium]